jgi:hypothetical protein
MTSKDESFRVLFFPSLPKPLPLPHVVSRVRFSRDTPTPIGDALSLSFSGVRARAKFPPFLLEVSFTPGDGERLKSLFLDSDKSDVRAFRHSDSSIPFFPRKTFQ